MAAPHIVVIGSGLAGYGVVRELRRLAPDSRLTMVTGDEGHFYSKPALSTALAKGKGADALITTPASKMAEQLRIDLRTGRQVDAIDRDDKAVLTTGGPVFYDKLVLAVGAEPVRPPLDGDAAHRALVVNDLDHYREFRQRLAAGARVLVIGGGLVGTEFANDLSAAGYRPVVVDMLAHPLAQLVPPGIGERVRQALADRGVGWRFGRKVLAIQTFGEGARAVLDDGSYVETDIVLSAIGLRPRVELALDAGLEVGRGIRVDATGRTSDPDIFAIGDCAEYPQGLAAYVTPIMAAARAIAAGALGRPVAIRFPSLSVQVKTTAYPIVLLPAPPGVEGTWDEASNDRRGLRYLFRDSDRIVRAYVLTQDYCQDRVEMDRMIGEQTMVIAA